MGGCCSSDKAEVKLTPQTPPAFALAPHLVAGDDEKAAYALMERASWKSFFTGQDNFKVKRSTEPGKCETCMKIKQSAWDMGQDRMELKDEVNDKVVAVVRRARLSVGDCFYIYVPVEPYKGAQTNNSNEELDGQRMYCFGFLQSAWGWGYNIAVYYADPEKGAQPDGKDPYKVLYKMQTPGWFSPDTVIFPVGEDGNIVGDKEQAVAYASRDRWQWDFANAYAVEVAPGVDAALMVISMAMLDEILEDNASDNS